MNSKKKKKAHEQRVETRRLYRFEAAVFLPGEELAKYASRPRSEKFLKNLATKVWKKHGRKNVGVPNIEITEGTFSYCLGYSDIVLARATNTRFNLPHNTVDVLLHELTHAMGYQTHGKSFVKKYVQLLVEYGKLSEDELLFHLAMFNIKIPHGNNNLYSRR